MLLSFCSQDAAGAIWSAGFGYADKEKKITATSETLFGLASVSNYLPEFDAAAQPAGTKPVTVRNLLTHHSGIQPDWLKGMLHKTRVQEPDNRFTETAELLKGTDRCWPPEYVWAYSNLGYSLLGTIINRCSGDSFYEYMQKNVLGAAGKKSSGYAAAGLSPDQMSAGYSGGKQVSRLTEREVPAGGLASSADDLGS